MMVLCILCQNPESFLYGAPRGRVVKVDNLKRSKSLNHLTTVGLSLARGTCELSQVLLTGYQEVFLEDLPSSLI